METPHKKLRERIEEAILNGERIKDIYDIDSPTDLYIIERLAYYRFVIPMMTLKGTNILSEDDFSNCLIDMYNELKNAGRIYFSTRIKLPPQPDEL
jgi:hypothetical protein